MKRRRSRKTYQHSSQPIAWLPVDSRLFPFFSFSHVRGVARIFLILEMVLSVTTVIGTLLLTIVHFLPK